MPLLILRRPFQGVLKFCQSQILHSCFKIRRKYLLWLVVAKSALHSGFTFCTHEKSFLELTGVKPLEGWWGWSQRLWKQQQSQRRWCWNFPRRGKGLKQFYLLPWCEKELPVLGPASSSQWLCLPTALPKPWEGGQWKKRIRRVNDQRLAGQALEVMQQGCWQAHEAFRAQEFSLEKTYRQE